MSSTEQGGGYRPGPPTGEQTGHYGTYQPSYPATDVLASSAPEPEPKRARWAVVALAGALVLALVGGVSWAVGSLSGGGAQPEDALPAGAIAFVKVDLDPSAGQKIDGFRFLRKFPALRERIPLDGDVRKVLFEAFAEEAGWQDIDFDSEVDPWLGDRVGLAGYAPEGDQLTNPTVVALQVSDAGKAEAGLRRLVDASQDGVGGTGSVGFVIDGDYALLAESQELAETYARKAADKALADDDRYASDVAELGDGVAAIWLDNAGIAEAAAADAFGLGVGSLAGGGDGSASGRSTMVARFAGPDVFEVVGSVAGAEPAGWSTHAVEGFGDLPASTVLAFGLADGSELVPRMLDAFEEAMPGGQGAGMDEALREIEDETGLELPEDLQVLLGDNLLGALDGGAGGGTVEGGIRVRTDVARAMRVLEPLVAQAPDDVVLRNAGDSYLLTTTDAQADRLASDGTLSEKPGFDDALPDLADADVALWADPGALVQALFGGWSTGAQAETDPNLAAVAGVGVTASSRDDGKASFRFRIVAR